MRSHAASQVIVMLTPTLADDALSLLMLDLLSGKTYEACCLHGDNLS